MYISFSSLPFSRWGRLRATMMPLPVLFEPFTECLLLGFIGSCVIHYLMSYTSYQHVLLVSGLHRFIFIFVCHTLIWLLCDLLLIRVIEVSDPLIRFDSYITDSNLTSSQIMTLLCTCIIFSINCTDFWTHYV